MFPRLLNLNTASSIRARVRGHSACALAALLMLAVIPGCVRRVATLTSDPTGARVYLNGVYRGETPVEIPYNWNWYYDVRLEKPGFETQTVRERFYAPAKHVMPLDFFAEFTPGRSEEDQWRHYCLQKEKEL